MTEQDNNRINSQDVTSYPMDILEFTEVSLPRRRFRLVNLTPHTIDIWIEADESHKLTTGRKWWGIRIPPSGQVARVRFLPGDDLPVFRVIDPPGILRRIPVRAAPILSGVENLPPPEDGTFYIVSQTVALTVRRPDVFYPDTGEDAIRDEKGNIVAVRRLIRSM
jgi:hypothetical protein